MNSISDFQFYHHDVIGKQKDISLVISSMDKSCLTNPEHGDTFLAIHEVLLRMVSTSKKVMEGNLPHSMTLALVDEWDLSLPELSLGKLLLKYTPDMQYFLKMESQSEDELLGALIRINTLLPIKEVKNLSESPNASLALGRYSQVQL